MVSTYTDLKRDLHRGKRGEDKVQKLLKDELKIPTVNVGKDNPHWDLEVDVDEGRKYPRTAIKKYGETYEVKTDDTSQKTGNFYLEVWSNREHLNAGCIPNCKADTIVIVSGNVLYFVDRALFYTWVFENLFLNTELANDWRTRCERITKNGTMVSAQNNKDVEGILIPLKDIKKSYCCLGVFTYKGEGK
jgi:hypothetical protein